MVRKYIQSALEEKLSTSDIGVQWCSAKIVSGPVYLILQLSSAAIPSINNVFLGEGLRSHTCCCVRGSVALCGDWVIIFLYFLDGGGGSPLVTGSVAGSFCFLWGWRLLLVGRYPPACCSSRLPVFLLRLLQKVNGAQCQQLSLAVLLASWSSVTSLSSAVASWCGSSGDRRRARTRDPD
jgi:hypothetical protein